MGGGAEVKIVRMSGAYVTEKYCLSAVCCHTRFSVSVEDVSHIENHCHKTGLDLIFNT